MMCSVLLNAPALLLQTDAADGNVDWKTQAKGVFTDIKVSSVVNTLELTGCYQCLSAKT